jgi:hypothetical protein
VLAGQLRPDFAADPVHVNLVGDDNWSRNLNHSAKRRQRRDVRLDGVFRALDRFFERRTIASWFSPR